jgi:hypothetical protein
MCGQQIASQLPAGPQQGTARTHALFGYPAQALRGAGQAGCATCAHQSCCRPPSRGAGGSASRSRMSCSRARDSASCLRGWQLMTICIGSDKLGLERANTYVFLSLLGSSTGNLRLCRMSARCPTGPPERWAQGQDGASPSARHAASGSQRAAAGAARASSHRARPLAAWGSLAEHVQQRSAPLCVRVACGRTASGPRMSLCRPGEVSRVPRVGYCVTCSIWTVQHPARRAPVGLPGGLPQQRGEAWRASGELCGRAPHHPLVVRAPQEAAQQSEQQQAHAAAHQAEPQPACAACLREALRGAGFRASRSAGGACTAPRLQRKSQRALKAQWGARGQDLVVGGRILREARVDWRAGHVRHAALMLRQGRHWQAPKERRRLILGWRCIQRIRRILTRRWSWCGHRTALAPELQLHSYHLSPASTPKMRLPSLSLLAAIARLPSRARLVVPPLAAAAGA